jgi:hypothetical protein
MGAILAAITGSGGEARRNISPRSYLESHQ